MPQPANQKWNMFLWAAFIVFAMAFAFHEGAHTARAGNMIASTSSPWAWNDFVGWIDFYNTGPTAGQHNATLTSQKLQGYASSSVGTISFDCATTPSGNICSGANGNYAVVNDGTGLLSGWAWNDAYGWVSFCGGSGSSDCPGSIPYRVTVTNVNGIGIFSGWAWNDILGWISFNCQDITPPGPPTGICSRSNYYVSTSWVAAPTSGVLESSTFDTGVSGGAQINSITWLGSLPNPVSGSSVNFQIAVASTSTGPWNYFGCTTPNTCGSSLWYSGNPSSPISVDYALHNNARYFRYMVKLVSNTAQTATPVITDISVNWSR